MQYNHKLCTDHDIVMFKNWGVKLGNYTALKHRIEGYHLYAVSIILSVFLFNVFIIIYRTLVQPFCKRV